MHETKCKLIERNGLRCMGCGKQVEMRDLQWHHIVPKYVAKRNKQPPDDSYENGSLLCKRCHIEIHRYSYFEMEYQMLTDLIEDNKQ